MTERKVPKVFISYSWTSEQHKQWVLELAERLRRDGVDAILDRWDLKEGHDKHAFMERLVNDTSIDKVLIICDKGYQEKANQRKGGAGTESQIISPETYNNVSQEKFIPIVREYDDSGKPCVPTFIKNAMYIDLSGEEYNEDEYEKLLRNIFNKPAITAPPIGQPPKFIQEDNPVRYTASTDYRRLAGVIEKGLPVKQGQIRAFLDSFLDRLKSIEIAREPNVEIDDVIVTEIQNTIFLRNEFCDILMKLARFADTEFIELYHDFFSKCLKLRDFDQDDNPSNRNILDFYSFIIRELFMYTIAILIENEKYNEVAYLIHTPYVSESRYGDDLSLRDYTAFDAYIRTLDEYRNKRLDLTRLSVTADLIQERANWNGITFNYLMNVDCLLFYLSFFKNITPTSKPSRSDWFPRTTAFHMRKRITFFTKMVMKRHFEKVAAIFHVKDVREMQAKVLEIQKLAPEREAWRYDFRFPEIVDLIETDKIASIE